MQGSMSIGVDKWKKRSITGIGAGDMAIAFE